jgi:exosortase/archaeosortase family protein
MTLACLASIGAVFVSFLATHPSDAVFQTMTEFILRHRVIGGPLVASYLASTMTIVFIPLCFLFFPLHFLRANRLKIFFIFIGLQFCLFVTVLEAVYHSFFSPYLLKTVVAIIHLFLQNVYADPARSILSANNFLVRVGPACSGLSFLILFISFFSYVLWSFSRKAQIQKIRAAIIFFTGILLMFLLNAFRIASIMILGTVAPNLAMNLFHSAVGAIMFFLFFLLFLPVMKKWVFVGHGRQ